jgi:hypothetical protein
MPLFLLGIRPRWSEGHDVGLPQENPPYRAVGNSQGVFVSGANSIVSVIAGQCSVCTVASFQSPIPFVSDMNDLNILR